jgi:hypothetical protein
MPNQSQSLPETIECPLCSGAGRLSRAEILDRLGVKDFARVAQLSAEEAFRLLTQKHDREEQSAWSRFEVELAKRTAEIRERHKDELRTAQSERDDLTRRVEACLREVAELRERNQALESELSKVARVGKREEMPRHSSAEAVADDPALPRRPFPQIFQSSRYIRDGDCGIALPRQRDPLL